MVFDCQGFNNQFDVEVAIKDQNDAAWKGEGKNEATKKQDIILFATTYLFSSVILFYYPVALDLNQIAIITETCELLSTWKQKDESFMKSKFKPRLVFLRRNMPVDANQHPIN